MKKREYWGLRNLTYRMNKNRKGHYVLFNIEAPAPAIAELERTMRISEDVLRYLTLRVEKLDEGPRRSCRAAAAARTGRAATATVMASRGRAVTAAIGAGVIGAASDRGPTASGRE